MKTIIKIFICFSLIYTPIFAFAAASRDEYLLSKQIQAVQEQNRVYGIRAVVARENVPISGTTQTQVRELIKRSIAVDTPTASKVGSSMLKRIYSPQAIVGTAAVTGLLAAIGWVMEDGVYVKKVELLPDPADPTQYQYKWRWDLANPVYDCYSSSSCKAVGQSYLDSLNKNAYQVTSCSLSGTNIICLYKSNSSGTVYDWTMQRFPNDKYNPKPPETKTVPLTAALLGAAMLGRGYTDPDPNFDNDTVNTGVYNGVAETYEHDPSGVGDEVADDMDDKLDRAPQTPDNTPSPIPDPNYDNVPLDPDSDKADRSWTEKGDEATGTTEPTKHPVTGEDTGGQSISLQFPLFCSWASKMCLWYDDWKESDKVHQKFEEDVKTHQTEEKSFWQTVRDWFNWSKEDIDLPDDEKPQISEIPTPELKEDAIRWSAQCPADAQVPINMQGVSSTITFSWSPWCQLLDMIKPAIIASAYIGAAFIVLGLRT